MAAAPTPKKADPYALDAGYERALATLLTRRPKLFGRIGASIEVDSLASPEAKLAIETAQAIAADRGTGPDSSLLVIQRLRRYMSEGRVTQKQIEAVSDYFDAAEDAGLPSEESVAGEIVPILKRRVQLEAVKTGMEKFQTRGDFDEVKGLLEKAERLGVVDESIGILVGPGSFDAIVESQQLERLPTGIPELDIEIDGGLWRGALGIFLGGAGDGKSMALAHVSASALLERRNVAVATLELPEPLWLARLKSNLTGIPIHELTGAAMPLARKRMEALQGKIGKCACKYFPAHATTIEDIHHWVDAVEQKFGESVELTTIDYLDKVGVKGAKDEYTAMRMVYEGQRIWTEARKRFSWTGSQSTRKDDKAGRKKNDIHHMADSIHKGRVADLVIGMTVEDETRELTLFVAKNRIGRGRMTVGPLPTEFECARLVPRVG